MNSPHNFVRSDPIPENPHLYEIYCTQCGCVSHLANGAEGRTDTGEFYKDMRQRVAREGCPCAPNPQTKDPSQ